MTSHEPALQSFSPSIWTIDHPLSIAGARMGTRSTIIRLPSDALAIISPIPFSDPIAESIDALGEVSTIIAPNLFHNLYFDAALRRWPHAMGMTPPYFTAKVDVHREVTDMGHRGSIEDALFWRRIEGMPIVRESAFVFPEDQTLILTDLLFHFRDHPQWWLRQLMRLNGAYGRLTKTRLFRSQIKDKQAFQDSVDDLFEYPWDRLIIAHGQCIKEGARAPCEAALK